MQWLNIEILQFLNDFSSYSYIALVSPFLADAPIFFLPLFLVSMWLHINFFQKEKKEKKLGLMYIFYACVLAIIISLIIQQFIHFERPETAISNAGKLLLKHIPDASFPSDHASVSVAFLAALFLTNYKKTFYAFLPWVILMLFSRIIVGVHWPFDILVGILIGIFSGYITLTYLPKIKLVNRANLFIIQMLSYIQL